MRLKARVKHALEAHALTLGVGVAVAVQLREKRGALRRHVARERRRLTVENGDDRAKLALFLFGECHVFPFLSQQKSPRECEGFDTLLCRLLSAEKLLV